MAISGILDKIPAELGLVKFSEKVGKVLDENPLINKIVVLANFVFRIAMMITFMAILPFSILPNFLISAGASIFYRITIERFCQYRFAILSCAAAGAYEVAKPAILAVISATAFSSLTAFGTAIALMTPLFICGGVIVAVTNHNVNDRYQKTHPINNYPGSKNLPKIPKKQEQTESKGTCCHASSAP